MLQKIGGSSSSISGPPDRIGTWIYRLGKSAVSRAKHYDRLTWRDDPAIAKSCHCRLLAVGNGVRLGAAAVEPAFRAAHRDRHAYRADPRCRRRCPRTNAGDCLGRQDAPAVVAVDG